MSPGRSASGLDATLSMPPYQHWLRGPDEVQRWCAGHGRGRRGSLLYRRAATGSAAFGQDRPGGRPWALQVIATAEGKITVINSFLDTERLFPPFELPLRVEAGASA